ncbi:MAG: NAD(+) synthase, partial [Anaerolineaceae bacterium]
MANTEKSKQEKFDRDTLHLNAAEETQKIVASLQQVVHQRLRKRGAVVGISGGIDSSVTLALCTRAFGAQNVLGVIMPEKESDPESQLIAIRLAESLQVQVVIEELTLALESLGCYRRRDDAIRSLFPDFGKDWKSKITLPGNLLENDTFNIFTLTVASPTTEDKESQTYSKRLPLKEYLQIVAASNLKQRLRMATLYFHAERSNYAVIGTANKNERELGFFVKYGDGGVDVSPITHLFKTQVFQLAEYLDIPQEIQQRIPTTDTYSAGSTQEEFFFRLPFELLDTIWFGYEHG